MKLKPALLIGFVFFVVLPALGANQLMNKFTSPKGANAVNEELAYRFMKPNNTVLHEVFLPDGSPLLTVTYIFDYFGHRRTPSKDIDHGTRHALFFGCSYVFGAKLNDEDTLPSHFAKQNPDYWSANFGISGYGVFDVLRQMELDLSRYRRAAPPGFAFYLYLPFHRQRSGGAFFKSPNMEWTPQYRWQNNQLRFLGSWSEVHPALSWILQKLKRWNFDLGIRSLRGLPGMTGRLMNEDVHQAVHHSFPAIRDEYLKSFPEGRFIVGLGPHLTERDREMFAELTRQGIETLDLSDLPFDEEIIHPLDAHPNSKLNEMIARKITSYLAENPKPDSP